MNLLKLIVCIIRTFGRMPLRQSILIFVLSLTGTIMFLVPDVIEAVAQLQNGGTNT